VAGIGHFEDLTFDGTNIWAVDFWGLSRLQGIIAKIDPTTLTVVSSFVPAGIQFPRGIAWDGSGLWVSAGNFGGPYIPTVTRFDTSGNPTGQSFNPTGFESAGLAFDTRDNTLWVGDSGIVRHYSATGTLLGSFAAPPSGRFVDGLEFQGTLAPVDDTPPSCALTRVIAGPPTQIQITTQDTGSGLAEINVLEQTNATVAFNPPLTPGTTDPVVVTATKIIQSQGARVALEVIDGNGNLTTCDPILTQAIRANGQPVSDTLSGIPPEESQVTVRNGNPGVAQLEMNVNGTTFRVSGLAANQEKTIDVSVAMVAGDINTIILTAYGKPGASATILIHD